MKKRILVAEDEQDIQELIEFTLRYGGYDVLNASNGKEALEITQKEQPDLVLMDIRMPVMSGLEACKFIKSNPKTEKIPIVFLTAKGQKSEISEGLEAGAIDYLLKPFSPEELNKRLREILESDA